MCDIAIPTYSAKNSVNHKLITFNVTELSLFNQYIEFTIIKTIRGGVAPGLLGIGRCVVPVTYHHKLT